MAWVPSHQELRDHPKVKRAARKAGVPVVQMFGHLHALWWWALDHAPDGDVSRFDDEDIADAAMWEGDPSTLVKALIECGPGDTHGFLEDGGLLHDWDEYGGAYARRVKAGRKAAAMRWHSDSNANALGDAKQPQSNANAEESRVEDSTKSGARKRATQLPKDWKPKDGHAEIATEMGASLEVEQVQFCDYHTAKGSTFKDWDAAFRTWLRNTKKYGGGGTNGQVRKPKQDPVAAQRGEGWR
ncbi:MAG: hypothetical protein LC679_06865 [Intrasporangiaceae bacterium]|nr:hypothetical protein [Intrasporangiaceae bacterium]